MARPDRSGPDAGAADTVGTGRGAVAEVVVADVVDDEEGDVVVVPVVVGATVNVVTGTVTGTAADPAPDIVLPQPVTNATRASAASQQW